jgi:YVTN family beta-propeller protein
VSPDGGTLYVANADNNCVCVIDIAVPHRSVVKGFIPTGWYPVSVAVTPDGKNLLVGVGKGLTSKSNPRWKKGPPGDEAEKAAPRRLPFPYIGTLMLHYATWPAIIQVSPSTWRTDHASPPRSGRFLPQNLRPQAGYGGRRGPPGTRLPGLLREA